MANQITGDDTFSITIATIDDINSIMLVSNDAFTAGAFFKKKEYQIRFTTQNIAEMFNSKNSVFLIARCEGIICGSVYVHYEINKSNKTAIEIGAIDKIQDSSSQNTTSVLQILGKFYAVSVDRSYQKRGLGQLLVKAAEEYLTDLSKNIRVKESIDNIFDMSAVNGSSNGSMNSDSTTSTSNNNDSNSNNNNDVIPFIDAVEISIFR